jgi:hypothetical protein
MSRKPTDDSSIAVTDQVEAAYDTRAWCSVCERLEQTKTCTTIRYRDLVRARGHLLEDGVPVSPSLAAAIVKAEIALNAICKILTEHQAVCVDRRYTTT